jgi:hypothetical protein
VFTFAAKAIVAGASGLALVGGGIAASVTTTSSSQAMSEVNNGAEFALSAAAHLADSSAPHVGYADAGVVVPVGLVKNLKGSNLSFTTTGPVLVSVWIGDGPQASTPGVYPMASPLGFAYGLGRHYRIGVPTSFYMQGSMGAATVKDGQTLTFTQLTRVPAWRNLEAYVWVGVTSSGKAVKPFVIKTIDGQQINKTVQITSTDGVLVPSVS